MSSESDDSAHTSDTDLDEEALTTGFDATKCDPYRSDLIQSFHNNMGYWLFEI